MSTMLRDREVTETAAERIAREAKERRALVRIRARKVEILKLPFCKVCGGATGGTEDVELYCDCDARTTMLQRRLWAKVRECAGDTTPLVDVIAP